MHPLLHTRIGSPIEDQGVEIAIAGVEHVGDAQAMLPAQVADGRQHLGQGGAGHHAVLEVVAGRLAAQGRDRRFAPLPEPGPGGPVPGLAHAAGARLQAQAGGQLHRILHLLLLAIELDQQHGSRLARVFVEAEVVVHRLNAGAVHHFHAGGQHPGAGDLAHRLAGRRHRGEIGQQHGHTRRGRQQPQGDRRGDAQGALAADKHPAQIEGRHFRLGAAQGRDRAVGEHHLHGQHMVAGDAVLEAMDAAGVFGNVAADRADLLAGGIGGVIKAVAHHRAGHPAVDHAGLHGDALVGQIHREHLAHAAGGNHQGLPLGHGPAGKPGAAAPGHKGNRALVAEPQHRRHLLGGFRQHHQGGLVALQGEAVAVVGEQLLAGCHHRLGWQQLAQGPGQLRPVVAMAGARPRRRAVG